MQLLIWCMPFFSLPAHKDHQKQLAFSWQSEQYTFTVLPPGYTNSPGLCQDLVTKAPDPLSLP